MKTRMVFLLVVCISLCTVKVLALGVVNFSNLGEPPEGRIYSGDWVFRNGGFEFVTWQPCAGNNFHISLYWGPQGTPAESLLQVGPSAIFLTGTSAGMFVGGNRTISTPEAGPTLTFQVRAWAGSYGTYEQAFAAGSSGDPGVLVGAGPVFDFDTADPLALPYEFPSRISDAEGWRGFIFGPDNVTVILVPEPSTIALAVLGAASLLFFGKRRA